jgi:hypothetical protein
VERLGSHLARRRALFSLVSLAFVVFAHFWTKYRDGVHRRARERETLEWMARARSTCTPCRRTSPGPLIAGIILEG